MADIFISYASEDRPRAKVLAEALEACGWGVWWDRKIPIGKSFHEVIEKAIADSNCVVVLWSRYSASSDWVRNEAEEGKRRGILTPALLEQVTIPLGFRHLQAANLFDWEPGSSHAEFNRLVESITHILATPPVLQTTTATGGEPWMVDGDATPPVSSSSPDNDRGGLDVDLRAQRPGSQVNASASEAPIHHPKDFVASENHPVVEEGKAIPFKDTAEDKLTQSAAIPPNTQAEIAGKTQPISRSRKRKLALLTTAFGLLIVLSVVGTVVVVQWQDEQAARDVIAKLRESAEAGLVDKQYLLAEWYSEGRLVPKDDAEAMRWYRKAAEHGHAAAQYFMGNMYAKGRGVPKDDAEAMRWYRKAAEQGHAAAQYSMGDFYAEGWGVPTDDAEATRWYRKAAEQGDAPAQRKLGAMYALGRGLTRNQTAAAHWFRKAAEQGDAQAQTMLGFIYADGRGVPEDDAEALKWWRKAAEQGEPGAQKQMKKLGLTW